MNLVRVITPSGRSEVGEAPLWSSRDNAVYWVDVLGARVHRLSLVDHAVDSWDMPETICWVIERESRPGFIAGFASGFAEVTLDPIAIRPIGNPEPDLPGNRLNDAKADLAGRIWAGTVASDCTGEAGASTASIVTVVGPVWTGRMGLPMDLQLM